MIAKIAESFFLATFFRDDVDRMETNLYTDCLVALQLLASSKDLFLYSMFLSMESVKMYVYQNLVIFQSFQAIEEQT